MKVLYMHAKELQIEAGIGGKTPGQRRRAEASIRRRLGDALLELTDSNRKTTAANALLAFVCVEKGDEKLALAAVKDDILRARARIGVAEIVIGAFGHLSKDVASAMLARSIIDDLLGMVRAEFPATKTFPFGWDKSIELRIPLHHYNVAFRSFEL